MSFARWYVYCEGGGELGRVGTNVENPVCALLGFGLMILVILMFCFNVVRLRWTLTYRYVGRMNWFPGSLRVVPCPTILVNVLLRFRTCVFFCVSVSCVVRT